MKLRNRAKGGVFIGIGVGSIGFIFIACPNGPPISLLILDSLRF